MYNTTIHIIIIPVEMYSQIDVVKIINERRNYSITYQYKDFKKKAIINIKILN